jgi:hypothetical protein
MERLNSMAHSKNFPTIRTTLSTTSYHDQMLRQRISDHWLPQGMERYQQTVQDLAKMPVVGAIGEPGYPAERFQPVGPLELGG